MQNVTGNHVAGRGLRRVSVVGQAAVHHAHDLNRGRVPPGRRGRVAHHAAARPA